MPTANIYTSEMLAGGLETFAPMLKQLLAHELTCGERVLVPDEISIRIIAVTVKTMIAPVEIDIIAHAYEERAKRSDKICLIVREFMRKHLPSAQDIRVWLILGNLGHS